MTRRLPAVRYRVESTRGDVDPMSFELYGMAYRRKRSLNSREPRPDVTWLVEQMER